MSRVCDSARVVPFVVRRVSIGVRAELGLILDPDNDLRRFGYTRVVRFTVVHAVLHEDEVLRGRSDLSTPLYPGRVRIEIDIESA